LVVCDFCRTIRACGCLLLLFMRFGVCAKLVRLKLGMQVLVC
jgi:hypothetical protein